VSDAKRAGARDADPLPKFSTGHSDSKLTNANQADLRTLAKTVRTAHQAVGTAMRNAVTHSLDAGDALIEAQGLVPAGQWGRWLRENCFLSTRTAQLYMQLAVHRTEIEVELERVTSLSLRAARRLIMTPKSGSAGVQDQRQATAGKLERTVTSALRQALSLQKDASEGVVAPGVANALNGILGRLQSAGLTLHDITIEIRGTKSAKRAAK